MPRAMSASAQVYVPVIDALIDQGIATLVAKLNQEGYTTAYSCSGIWSEHLHFKPARIDSIGAFPYIAFRLDDLSRRQLHHIEAVVVRSEVRLEKGLIPGLCSVTIQSTDEERDRILKTFREASLIARRQKKMRGLILERLIRRQGGFPERDHQVRRAWQMFTDNFF